jgi:AcrR family transcriptional regulator
MRTTMPVKSKKADRRTNRTRRSLSAAMVELVKEKRFDNITVQNVIDRADVGRSTFYSHFRDKEDLFAQQWEGFLDFLAQQIDWNNAGQGSFMPVNFLFAHLQEAQTFYKGLVRSRMTDSIFKSGVAHLSGKIENALTDRLRVKPLAAIPIPILSHYLASELFNLLQWWLDQKMPYPPERMDEIFHDLVNPTFRFALNFAEAGS